MSKIFDKLYVSGTGSGDSLSVYTSTASSNLINISSATTSYDTFKIKSYADNLTYTSNIVTTYAGTGTTTFNGENIFRTSFNINNPSNISFDNNGDMYVCHNYRISKVDKITGLITTIAGSSSQGTVYDCPATDARFYSPRSIIFDEYNNFLVLDINDGGSRWWRILKYTATASYISSIYYSGTADNDCGYTMTINPTTKDLYVPTYAGSKIWKLSAPTYSVRELFWQDTAYIFGIDFDSNSNSIYFTTGNYVKKITGLATSSTIRIAGNGTTTPINNVIATQSGIFTPTAIKFYNNELYLADRDNNIIRKINSNGIIKTISGNGATGFSGDNGPGLSASFYNVYDISFSNNEMYIADTTNNRIRKSTLNGISNSLIKEQNILSVRGDGLVKLNGNFQLKDINFATSSYATNSLLRGDVTNFILQDGTKINSAWFKSTDFAKNGTMFWMEPGYSRTWQAYSTLGDVSKLNLSLSFATDSLVSFPVNRNSNFPGSTFSDIYNILLSSSGTPVNLPIFKTYSTNSISVNIDTYGATLSNLDVTLIGRNINIGSASSATYSISGYLIEFYVLNTLSTTASFTVSTSYFTNQNYTISPYSFTQLTTKVGRVFNDYYYMLSNHGLYTSYFYSTNGSSLIFNQNTINVTASYGGINRSTGSGNYLVWILNSAGITTNRTLVKLYGQNLLSTTYSITYNSPLVGATVSYTLSPSQSGSPSALQLINGAAVGTTWSSGLSFINNNAVSLRHQAYYSTTGTDTISINQLLSSGGVTNSVSTTLTTGGTNSYKFYITSTS